MVAKIETALLWLIETICLALLIALALRVVAGPII